MATMKAILFLTVVFGAMSLASAGDASVTSSRKMLGFFSRGVGIANAGARCANGFFFFRGGCIARTRTNSFASPFFSSADSNSLSATPGGGFATGSASARAFGRNPVSRTNTQTSSGPFGASSSSSSFASAGGK